MDIYLPTKESWISMEESIANLTTQLKAILEIASNKEHFPDYMTIEVASKYLHCPKNRIKGMIYKQKILETYHIELNSTVYVSKKEIDDLRFRAIAMRKMKNKQI